MNDTCHWAKLFSKCSWLGGTCVLLWSTYGTCQLVTLFSKCPWQGSTCVPQWSGSCQWDTLVRVPEVGASASPCEVHMVPVSEIHYLSKSPWQGGHPCPPVMYLNCTCRWDTLFEQGSLTRGSSVSPCDVPDCTCRWDTLFERGSMRRGSSVSPCDVPELYMSVRYIIWARVHEKGVIRVPLWCTWIVHVGEIHYLSEGPWEGGHPCPPVMYLNCTCWWDTLFERGSLTRGSSVSPCDVPELYMSVRYIIWARVPDKGVIRVPLWCTWIVHVGEIHYLSEGPWEGGHPCPPVMYLNCTCRWDNYLSKGPWQGGHPCPPVMYLNCTCRWDTLFEQGSLTRGSSVSPCDVPELYMSVRYIIWARVPDKGVIRVPLWCTWIVHVGEIHYLSEGPWEGGTCVPPWSTNGTCQWTTLFSTSPSELSLLDCLTTQQYATVSSETIFMCCISLSHCILTPSQPVPVLMV